MSSDRKDFDDRLAELSNWQIEQQKKLRAFQEAQRRLLDLEHENILKSLRIQNFDQQNNTSEEGITSNLEKHDTLENGLNALHKFRNKEINGIFQLKSEPIKLNEPKSSLFSLRNYSTQNHNDAFEDGSNENLQEREFGQQRKFLKRGEGLARFRMSLDDFKGPPKIYREKRIKTYLNGKPDFSHRSKSSQPARSSKNSKGSRNCPRQAQNKSAPVPVKIYVPENKQKKCNSQRMSEPKQKECKKVCDANLPKAPLQDLALKPCNVATEWYNLMKEKEKEEEREELNVHRPNLEIEEKKKKDEKELLVFEILEKKVDESSFCSTSSFVDKLMEQSLSSTPSKSLSSELSKKSYAQGLKSLQSQFLDEERIKKFEEFCEIPSEGIPEGEEVDEEAVEDEMDEVEEKGEEVEDEEEEEEEGEVEVARNEEIEAPESEEPEPAHKVNKTLLQEYIKEFKTFKHLLAENVHRIQEPGEEDLGGVEEEPPSKKNSQREIALNLQRKGLQDNVKQLLNWDSAPRKRQPKRLVKKTKGKFLKAADKSKAEKEQTEKIIFNSALLKTRLEELEKEIEIFRKENKNLEKLQRECSEEKAKLAKERKEFEKQMQEERERFEAKMAEEQRKLQKEKTVFEKYCKQVKSQPTRQEREEMANLKKEIEKLTETLTTKEGRWGAAQARLRNQIKSLEKENSSLKAENEKLKKASMKKVSFDSEKNINAKIIQAINSELGKLKPTVTKPLSARIERHTEEKPVRKVKSAPNVKKQAEAEVHDCDEKALGSVSTDSGIETNGSRYAAGPPREDDAPASRGDSKDRDSALGSHSFERLSESRRSTESYGTDFMESIVQDAIFGSEHHTNQKITEIKNRLERLNLYNREEGTTQPRATKMVRLPKVSPSESEEGSGSSADEAEVKTIGCCGGKGRESRTEFPDTSHSSRNLLMQSKMEESGVWEKVFEDGTKEINYPNGNVKKILPGSRIVKMVYYNGDIKETNVAEGSEKYYYAETKTWHTTYKDGLEVLEFPNGQTERRHADGSTEISFPNGCVRYCDLSGKDEWRFSDGTVIKTNESGHKILLMPNGQKEIHTKEYKRREYPDGTVKILYADGTQETRYASGRVRLKDKDGNLLMDSGGIS